MINAEKVRAAIKKGSLTVTNIQNAFRIKKPDCSSPSFQGMNPGCSDGIGDSIGVTFCTLARMKLGLPKIDGVWQGKFPTETQELSYACAACKVMAPTLAYLVKQIS